MIEKSFVRNFLKWTIGSARYFVDGPLVTSLVKSTISIGTAIGFKPRFYCLYYFRVVASCDEKFSISQHYIYLVDCRRRLLLYGWQSHIHWTSSALLPIGPSHPLFFACARARSVGKSDKTWYKYMKNQRYFLTDQLVFWRWWWNRWMRDTFQFIVYFFWHWQSIFTYSYLHT